MVALVRVYAKVTTDNSGYQVQLPILLMEDKVFRPLLDYLLAQHHRRSISWMNRMVYATFLLLEYMEANKDLFSSPSILFLHFAQRLCTGTIGNNGLDPSGLYWLPKSTKNVNQILTALNGFTDWLVKSKGSISLNPLIEASSYEERLNYAAWHKKNTQQFLGHIKPASLPTTIKQVRRVQGKLDVIKVDSDAISFPENTFKRFFEEGLGGCKDYRVGLRDQLIVLLMHGCGVRESDALHLWIQDVFVDPHHENNAIVRLYHPEVGRAPDDWKCKNKQTNRAAYLREKYALQPRNKLTGTARVGWKTKVVEHQDNYINLYWFPSYLGELFYHLWHQYLRAILPINRHHPYAFVSFSPGCEGQPYTLNAFNQNYKNAHFRIGLTASKLDGLTPHSHRHAYGRRLRKAGIDPLLRKIALHHSSLESQSIYTQPGAFDVTEACNKATQLLESAESSTPARPAYLSWKELVRTGFEDIDPNGLFSGHNPKFRR
ncbi:gamma-mobile-trio recombinase GmtY [Endozoicomonas numazuensis]|uniref:Integrase n=1 Tax=Endozoicomonas numazuensis TaxID=1137799 RepID=A0A081N6I2_9GAMM|nr:gamma-mobile-trio recombinase GmtY [Endozoicomonas numazuensis]KEQ14055.1 integrase [Endozoicomonas numazuensis]